MQTEPGKLLFIIYWGLARGCLGWRCVWLQSGLPGVSCFTGIGFSQPQRFECVIDISSTQCHFRLDTCAGESNMYVCIYSACVHGSSSPASCDVPIIRSQFHACNLVKSTAAIRNSMKIWLRVWGTDGFSLLNLVNQPFRPTIRLIIFDWSTYADALSQPWKEINASTQPTLDVCLLCCLDKCTVDEA